MAGLLKSNGDNAGLYKTSLFIFLAKEPLGLFGLDGNVSSNIEVGDGSSRDRTSGDGEDAELDEGVSILHGYGLIKE